MEIFKRDVYERNTLGFFKEDKQQYNKLGHYAFVLNQWVSGMRLNGMILEAIEHDTGNSRAKVKVNGKWVQFQSTPEHINSLIGNVLEDIESVITFCLDNYSLRFSQEYKRLHPDEKFMYWYEYVEYGSTNPYSIWLQRNGFSHEVATYIQNNFKDYFAYEEANEYRLKKHYLNVIMQVYEKKQNRFITIVLKYMYKVK